MLLSLLKGVIKGGEKYTVDRIVESFRSMGFVMQYRAVPQLLCSGFFRGEYFNIQSGIF
jgi:hypothetical protein